MNFRRAIGTIILDPSGNLIVFQRSDFPSSWQCPEGGIDEGETSEEALVRELHEEIGLETKDFDILKKTKNFIRYSYEGGVTQGNFNGQEKQFFLIKLKKSVAEIKFRYDNVAEEIEFLAYRIIGKDEIRGDELASLLPKFKIELYKRVMVEFEL
ncbi:MAG: NUDIX domain-containing protein [Rickettsiales bacterium]|jgi:putative (di)nucleoside polyphosphate hydrolase|nr:NUDIX domain-containing protein [Rickettsiales bacterium]